MSILIYKTGLLLGLSLITSIGTQNLFVIRQGLKKELPYFCALSCALCDALMIILGVTGISIILIKFPTIKLVILMAGILFLLIHGGSAFKRGLNKASIQATLKQINNPDKKQISYSKLILLSLSFSLLNPQALLDTLIIIGGNANQYMHTYKYLFVAGTITASFIWFIGLAFISHKFSTKLTRVRVWQMLEFFSATVMLTIAVSFIIQLF